MSDFIPTGYLSLAQAIERLTKARHAEMARQVEDEQAEWTLLYQRRAVTAARRASVSSFRGPSVSGGKTQAKAFSDDDAARLKTLEWRRSRMAELQQEERRTIRQALGDGALPSHGLTTWGSTVPIPVEAWRTDQGARAMGGNKIRWWAGHPAYLIEAVPLFLATEFIQWAAGITSLAGPAITLPPMTTLPPEPTSLFAPPPSGSGTQVPGGVGAEQLPAPARFVSTTSASRLGAGIPVHNDLPDTPWMDAGAAIAWIAIHHAVPYSFWSDYGILVSNSEIEAAGHALTRAVAERHVKAKALRRPIHGPLEDWIEHEEISEKEFIDGSVIHPNGMIKWGTRGTPNTRHNLMAIRVKTGDVEQLWPPIHEDAQPTQVPAVPAEASPNSQAEPPAAPALSPAPPGKIHEAITAIYDHARDNNMKPPNVRELPGWVQKRLSQGGLTASQLQIQGLADNPKHASRRLKVGVRAKPTLRDFSGC